MPKYDVFITVTKKYNEEIQAPDGETAVEMVEEMIDKNDIVPYDEDRESKVTLKVTLLAGLEDDDYED